MEKENGNYYSILGLYIGFRGYRVGHAAHMGVSQNVGSRVLGVGLQGKSTNSPKLPIEVRVSSPRHHGVCRQGCYVLGGVYDASKSDIPEKRKQKE